MMHKKATNSQCLRFGLLLLLAGSSWGCSWPTVTRGNEVLGDTIVQIFRSDGAVELSFFGKAAGFGPCPVEEAAAVSHDLHMSHNLDGGSDDMDACSAVAPALEATLFVKRGTCNFVNKTVHAETAGAAAVLVGNEAKDLQEMFLMSCPSELVTACVNISIPAVMLAPNDTAALMQTDIGMAHAVGFIFAASAALVLLFFFIRTVIFFMIILYCFAATSAFTAISISPLHGLMPSLASEAALPLVGKVERSALLAFGIGTTMAVTWFFNRHEIWAWPLQDILSVSLCIHILSLMRFPDAKVSATLLCLALLYDIFWVFISPLLFSENVMIGVATGEGHHYNSTSPPPPPSDMIPMLLVVPKIRDWAGGVTLLGLGDIVLPGLVVSYALRMDYLRRGTWVGGYFVLLVCGYGVGLAMAIIASVLMQMGQPALLYLVPCTLIPFFSLAWMRGEVMDVWNGPAGKAAGFVADDGDLEADFGREDAAPEGVDAASAQPEEIHQRLLDKGE